jgi:hypothetical protein
MNNQTDTIEIDLVETISTKKEIKLPYYTTDGSCHWYKVVTPKQAVQVYYSVYGGLAIQMVDISVALMSRNVESNSEDFTENFYKTLNQLNVVI